MNILCCAFFMDFFHRVYNQYKAELIPQYADMAIAMTIKIPTNVTIINGSEPKNNITRVIPAPK